MSTPSSFPYAIEQFRNQERACFACGIAELDNYLHRQASQDTKRKVAAPFVLVDQARRVIGYYTLSAYGIRAAKLPPAVAKKLPKYPLIPATLLGRLAVGKEHQGQRLGQVLFMDALKRSWKNAEEVRSIGVVAEALDDSARAFYIHHEFIPLAEHPRKLFIAMTTIQRAFL